MDEQTLVEAIMSTRSQIDFLWQFFMTVHIAIFALLFIYDRAVESLNIVARFFAVVGVGLFEWINGKAIANAYRLLDAMQEQYRWQFGQTDRFHPEFYQEFVLATFKDRPGIVLVTHGMAILVVIMALVSKHFIQSREANARDPRQRQFADYD